ncbi:MAG TPA: CPBP family intramembrane glutamic endopeptidase [Planktothrix sp.]|jgi:hypothetical protein
MAVLPKRRILAVMLLSLAPWPAVWLGMYRFSSIFITFFLYHGLCLFPAVVWGRKLWSGHWQRPTPRDWLLIMLGCILGAIIAVAAYKMTGNLIISKVDFLQSLSKRGFDRPIMVPLAIYFVVINATLEELFWRGVIYNELRPLSETYKVMGMVWSSAAFATWHYLVLRLLLQPPFAEITVIALVIFGLIMAWLYDKTKSIVLPILWHGLVCDFALVVLLAYILQTS